LLDGSELLSPHQAQYQKNTQSQNHCCYERFNKHGFIKGQSSPKLFDFQGTINGFIAGLGTVVSTAAHWIGGVA
jgi:hypothetical protein